MSDITANFPRGPFGRRGLQPSFPWHWVAMATVGALALIGASSAFVVVEPTEMAGKRRLGQVVVEQPLGPGLHLRWPLIEHVDRLQVSLETYKIDRLTVNTIDNQPITVAVGLSYRIPASAVLKLLYDVGRSGDIDIGDNFQRVIADRTAKIFAQQNTTTVSEARDRLSVALKALLTQDLRTLYGIEVVDFQIAGISYSDSFRNSVEAAVKAKNEAVAAENTVNRIRFEAQQAVARANGEAEAKMRLAEAERQATTLIAQGRAAAIRAEGEARAAVLLRNAEALQASPLLVDLARAERWNGALPQTLLDGKGSALPLLSLAGK